MQKCLVSPLHACKQRDWRRADNYTVVPLSGGGQLLVTWVVNGSAAVLAWRAADNSTEAMVADSVQMTAATFLAGDLTSARVNQATMDPFQDALQGSGSRQGIAGVRLFGCMHAITAMVWDTRFVQAGCEPQLYVQSLGSLIWSHASSLSQVLICHKWLQQRSMPEQ